MTVLIFGCPRSGTSILGELFEHIPRYQFYFEPPMQRVARLDHEQWTWALKNPIGPDPTPGVACNLDDLATLPDPMALFIVRHPLDVVCSMQSAMSIGVDHGPVPEHAQSITDPIERAAHIWAWINGKGLPAVQDRFYTHILRYEYFITKPVAAIDSIMRSTGICAEMPWAYIDSISPDTGGYEAKHQDRWTTYDHPHHIDRWRRELTDVQADICWTITGGIAEPMGYAR